MLQLKPPFQAIHINLSIIYQIDRCQAHNSHWVWRKLNDFCIQFYLTAKQKPISILRVTLYALYNEANKWKSIGIVIGNQTVQLHGKLLSLVLHEPYPWAHSHNSIPYYSLVTIYVRASNSYICVCMCVFIRE